MITFLMIYYDTLMDKYRLENNEILYAGEFRKVDVWAYGRPLTIYSVSSRLLFYSLSAKILLF